MGFHLQEQFVLVKNVGRPWILESESARNSVGWHEGQYSCTGCGRAVVFGDLRSSAASTRKSRNVSMS